MSGKQLIGIDIGTTTIKLVELRKKKKKGFTLVHTAEVPISSGVISEGKIMDYGEIVDALSRAYSASKFTHNEVAVALKGEDTVAKKINVPADSADDVDERFIWEAEQYVNRDMEEMSVDYTVVCEKKEEKMCTVLLAGAKTTLITDYISAVKSAQLEPVVIDLEPFALAHLYSECTANPQETAVIVHVGHSKVLVVCVRDKKFDYFEEISFAARDCAELVMHQAGLNARDTLDHMTTPALSEHNKVVYSIMKDVFARELGRRIEVALRHYSDKGNPSPSRLYLSGGAAGMSGLKERISADLSIPVEFLDPFTLVEVEPGSGIETYEGHPYALNIALGLAMRESD